jgi:hypothetical protein
MPRDTMVISFMFCSICLYIVMPKLLLYVRSKKKANMIFLGIWSAITITGVGLATSALSYL